MPPAAHVIYRQQLQLRLFDSAAGLAQQRQAEQALLAPALLAALSAVLDEALTRLPAGYWLTIDQLTLDAGQLTPAELDGQLLARLPDLLRRSLAELLVALPAGAALPPGWGAGQGLPDDGIPPGAVTGRPVSSLPAGSAGESTTQAPALAAEAAWLFFLANGYLPPHWPAAASRRQWEAELRPLFRAPAARLVAALRRTLQTAGARYRLLRQFSPGLVAAALEVLLPAGQVRRAQLARVLAALLRSPLAAEAAARPLAAEAVALALVEQAASPTAQPDWTALLAPLPPALAAREAPDTWALVLVTRLASASPHLATPLADRLTNKSAPPAGRPLDKPVLASLSGPHTPLGLAELPPRSLADQPAAAVPLDTAEYITNAGVVLLHPFLPACFASCGWLGADNRFVHPEAQAEAALLVHFLATGRGQASEYALRLPRLLCGIPTDTPSPPYQLKLSRSARAEGRALLRAAIAHWGALRGTTPGGLRAAFLQREGKLESLSNKLVLTVEQLPQDVLLDRLPYGWGVSLVPLPWLAQHLTVDWA